MNLSNCLEIITPHGRRLKADNQIGAGMFGYVLKVRDEDGVVSAIKIMPTLAVDMHDTYTTKLATREMLFHQYSAAINHPFVVQTFEAWSTCDHKKEEYVAWRNEQMEAFCINYCDNATQTITRSRQKDVRINLFFFHLKYYPDGNLHSWLHKTATSFQNFYHQRVAFSRDILSGVEFLHSKGLIHRDLSPTNILLDDTSDGNLKAVISDFGTIISCGSNTQFQLTTTREVHTRAVGTGLYAAPEVMSYEYDKACDLYSIGVIFLRMHFNLETEEHLQKAVSTIEHNRDLTALQCESPCHREFWLGIIKRQLSGRPELRVGCTELLQLLMKENSFTSLTVRNSAGSRLELKREIGSGAYGFVLHVVDDNGGHSALKMVPVISDESEYATARSEQLHELKQVDHLSAFEFQDETFVEKQSNEICASTEINSETQFISVTTKQKEMNRNSMNEVPTKHVINNEEERWISEGAANADSLFTKLDGTDNESNLKSDKMEDKGRQTDLYYEKTAKREAWFHHLNSANQCPNIVRSIDQWVIKNLTKSAYCEYRNKIQAKLSVKVLDAASKRIMNDAPEHSKITVYMLQMQFYPMGSLKRWLKENHKEFSETYAHRVDILRGTLVGLEYIHSRGLMHRDLCPPNVLLEECSGKIIAKIGDFGTATNCGVKCDWKLTKTRDSHTRGLGTTPYCAPEVERDRYDERCDLFSFGMIVVKTMWDVKKKRELFKMQNDLLTEETEHIEKYSKSLPYAEDWLGLIKSLVTQKPKIRPDCKTLLQKKMFSDESGDLYYLHKNQYKCQIL